MTTTLDISFHYPPELFNLLVDVIPLLNRSKKDIFIFFKGAGLSEQLYQQPYSQWIQSRKGISKYEIVRQVLTTLNERGERCLRERREVLKRVVEFESFSACWEADQLKARGLVAEIQKVVNVKDSFTRISLERESERNQRAAEIQARRQETQKRKNELRAIKAELFALFNETDRHKRGKALEAVLNKLFGAYGIGIREAFTLRGTGGEGVVEQIDGVIEVQNHLYFVELKWWDHPIGVPEVSQHLVRVYQRSEARALIISASSYTAPAISTCKDALQQKVVVLCTLQEIVMLLEQEGDLIQFIQKKAIGAMVDKDPFIAVTGV